MKTRGRPKSSNIEDRSSFHTNGRKNTMGGINEFLNQSRKAAREFKGAQPYNNFRKDR